MNCDVYDCIIEDIADGGIYGWVGIVCACSAPNSASGITIRDNIFRDSALNSKAIQVGPNDYSSTITDVEIYGNTFSKFGQALEAYRNTNGLYVHDNVATDMYSYFAEVYYGPDQVTIEDNTVTNCQCFAYCYSAPSGGSPVSKDFIIRRNTVNVDVGYFDYPWAQVYLGDIVIGTGQNLVSTNTIRLTGTLGAYPRGVFTGTTPDTAQCLMTFGEVESLQVLSNGFNCGNVQSSSPLFLPDVTAFLIETDGFWGPIPADTNWLVQGNQLENAQLGLATWNENTQAFGGLPSGAVVDARSNNLFSCGFGGRNGPTAVLDMRNGTWGNNLQAPSGGGVDPVTGAVANGTGSGVLNNVRFDPYRIASSYEPFSEPTQREPGRPANGGAPPTGTPGTDDSQGSIELAQYEGAVTIQVGGEQRFVRRLEPEVVSGMSEQGRQLSGQTSGVLMNWNDRPSRESNPGKA